MRRTFPSHWLGSSPLPQLAEGIGTALAAACLTPVLLGGALAAEAPGPFLTRPGVGPAEQTAVLPPGEGREEVEGICSACHSIRLVTQQRLSRDRWDELLDWMVAEQGMPELDDETRDKVLDYLADHLSPKTSG